MLRYLAKRGEWRARKSGRLLCAPKHDGRPLRRGFFLFRSVSHLAHNGCSGAPRNLPGMYPFKPTIPFHWSVILDALCGRRDALAERMTLIYAATGARAYDATGRQIQSHEVKDPTMYRWFAR